MPSSTISSLSSSALPTRTSIFRQDIGIPLPIAPSALCMKRIALCFLVLALLLVAPVVTEPQNRQANTTDLGAELEAYSHYIDDFHAAGKVRVDQSLARRSIFRLRPHWHSSDCLL